MRSTKSCRSTIRASCSNASLADYLLPTALDVPRMELAHTVTPSPLNPLGIKGAGEAGAIPVGPLFAQAIEDALQLKRGRSSCWRFRSARAGCSNLTTRSRES